MNEARGVWYFTDRGNKIAIIREARTKIHACMMTGAGLKVVRVGKAEEQYMKPVAGSLAKMARQMRAFGKTNGSTKQARELLRGV